VVATLCVTETITWGIVYYGFPVFLRAMEEHLHASRVAVTGAFSVGMGITALGAIPVGRWLDRRGPWVLMTLGSCLATALVFAWTRVESLEAFYVLWALFGVAMAATLYEPAFGTVVRWFPTHHRDRALTTVTLVAALASTIFMPIEAWLLPRLGWRGALMTLGIVLGVTTIPLHAIVLRRQPPSIEHRRRDAASPAPAVSFTLGEATRTLLFWVLTTAFIVGNFATVSVTVHLIPFLTDRGWSPAVAAATIGWMGAMQIPGRVLFAGIATRLGPRVVTTGVFLAQAVGVATVALVHVIPGGLAVVIVLLGASNGMSTLARATSVADVFGPRHYASISGAMALGANGARAIGPVGASLLYAAFGRYETVFLTLGALLAVVGVAVGATESRATASVEGSSESAV
jgi:MFS family permease